jgi:5-methylcytosine-specific restriction enzyme A
MRILSIDNRQSTIENMVLVCPNHHGAIHSCDAPFDYGDYAFDFGGHREGLQVNFHLP